jgi:hypothetical protein
VEETSDQGLEDEKAEGDSGDPGEESDVEDFAWDGLLIEDEDDESVYYSD